MDLLGPSHGRSGGRKHRRRAVLASDSVGQRLLDGRAMLEGLEFGGAVPLDVRPQRRRRSSASSRSRASRRSACTPAARRAISACRPSGPSCRRSSPVRSVSRVRLACIASSLRSAFSLRLRCLRTPAASSMNARRSSGRADRTASSWPCPTMTCISRPMPESDSSSWMSSSRQAEPLISYSPAPSRNIRRVIETSA